MFKKINIKEGKDHLIMEKGMFWNYCKKAKIKSYHNKEQKLKKEKLL